jgi:hypothetical protein
MTRIIFSLFILTINVSAYAFDVTTRAKVISINEHDIGYTQVKLDKNTDCGASWYFVSRSHVDYDRYMTRVLTALVADKEIIIEERASGWCTAPNLYNPRVGLAK